MTFSDGGNVGQADVTLEGPEPTLADLEAAFPAGAYTFEATTVTGGVLEGTGTLSYDLLRPPVIAEPASGATEVPASGLVIRWQPVTGAARIHFELEPEQAPPPGSMANPKLTIDLPGTDTEITIPDGWMESGVEYVFDIKAIADNGSVTVTDATFTTA